MDTDTGTPELEDRSLAARLERMTSLVLFVVVVLPVFVVFFATADRTLPYHIDPFSNAVPAWNIATRGSVYLEDHVELTGPDYYRSVAWFVAVDDTAVSQYPPGAALWGAIFYAVGPDGVEVVVGEPANTRGVGPIRMVVPSLATAAAAASLAVALAVGWVALTLRLFMRTSWAVAGALILAFGTSAWNVASSQLWQHGPAMMWIALGGYLVASSRYWSSGFAYGAAIVTRPITAIIAAGTGIGAAVGDRRRRLVQVGLGAAVGLAAVIAYNAVVFGSPSVSGGYGDSFVESTFSSGFGWFAGNLFGALFDPRRGLLVWSPWLLVLAPGLRAAWRSAPGWTRGAALGALVYLLVHYKANRFSGGDGFYGYRYPIEPLTAAAPLLALAYRDWVARRPWVVRVFAFAVVAAIALQTVAALR